MKRKPTGFIAHCQCGEVVGAMDYERTDRKEAGRILGAWIADGCAIYPRFDGTWQAVMGACKCEPSPATDTGKPSWDDAPVWAQWLAQDRSGECIWYEKRPYLCDTRWAARVGERSRKAFCVGNAENWRNTLQQRPSPPPATDTEEHP